MERGEKIRIVTTCPVSGRHRQYIESLAHSVDLQVYDSIEQASQALPEAEILVTYGEDLTSEQIRKCERLKWIQVISAGLEKMPFPEIAKNGILVTNARGIHAVPMSEYVMGVLLQIARRSLQFYDLQKQKEWDRSVRIDELNGATLGILGAGAIGTAIAEKAKAFGMRVIGMNTKGSPVPHIDEMVPRDQMDFVLQEADFLVIVVPLTDSTHQMIGERELKLMQKESWLINISRGDVVVETALLNALEEEWIGGAVLDVFQEEPLPAANPLWQAKNCILTPHISGRSPKYMERAMEIFAFNLNVYLQGSGSYVNLIDPAQGY